MLSLLKIRGFLAFVAVAFINAFVDLGHKIIVQNTLFKSYDGPEQVILTAIVNGLILLPFILLLSPAGFISDRFAKPAVMRWSARLAVLITLIITLSYYQGWFEVAFAMTFVLAVQSAIYSPAKYGYIRDLVGTDNLSEGNGWVQSATMVAILSGIVAFSLMFESMLSATDVSDMAPTFILQQIAPLGWLLVIGAVVEAIFAQRLPELTHTHQEKVSFDWQAYRKAGLLRGNLRVIWKRRPIRQSIFGLAVFWTISQVMLAVFPSFAESTLGESNTFVIQGAMALAGVGIMVGSMLAGRLSRNHINTGLIPLGAIGVALGLFWLPQIPSLYWSAADFFLIGLSGALMTIPLNALIQFHAPDDKLGKVLAGNNFIQNIAMIAGLVLTVVFSMLSLNETWLLYGLVGIAVIGAVQAIRTLPEAMIRVIVAWVMKRKYNLQVLGFEHIPPEGKGALLLGNHISWLDWAMIQMACPRHIHFVMERSIYERWYLKWFLDLFGVIPIAGGKSRQALERVNELLREGAVVCLFPEGAISQTGQLGEFKRGFERAAADSAAEIIPFYLRGLWGSRFSRSGTRLQANTATGIKRDVIVAFGAPLGCSADAATVKQHVFELSITAWERYTDSLPCLDAAFIRAMKSASGDWAIADVEGDPVGHHRLLTAVLLFRKRMRRLSGQNIGLLLPTSSGGAIANLAVLMAGKTVVNLNYTASPEALTSAVKQAQIASIVTSRLFITRLKARGVDLSSLLEGVEILYLEDVRDAIGQFERLSTLLVVKALPSIVLQALYCRSAHLDNTAAILFSSGSEGAPKGVMLSHRNMMANLKQISDVLNMQENDTIMASLPLFHAFGLTVTCYLPLIEGVPVVCHPDPTDALAIGKGVARYRATVLCATATFLRLYTRNRKLVPMMFSSLRIVVAGAEKLQADIREQFEQRFRLPVLEGYGCTETTPVASVNIPDFLNTQWWTVQTGNKPGTVGMALPGTMFRIVDPTTLERLPTGEAGLVLIGGTQIMKGYLDNPKKTAEVITEMDGVRWYKSGDKGWLDEDGFLTIVDRYSRFAKLGGEMVSLSEVESCACSVLSLDDRPLVAVNLPDSKKGEKIILLIEGEEPEELQDPRRMLLDKGIPPLIIPANVCWVEQIPVLGSGKTDFGASKQLASSLLDVQV